jgi:hypothetical protein
MSLRASADTDGDGAVSASELQAVDIRTRPDDKLGSSDPICHPRGHWEVERDRAPAAKRRASMPAQRLTAWSRPYPLPPARRRAPAPPTGTSST